MNLTEFNVWWKTKKVPPELRGRTRQSLNLLIPYLSRKQNAIIHGIRRAGKTTLMHQLIEHLIEKMQVDPFHILYFSFDELNYSLKEILDYYSIHVLKKDIFSEKIFFFFDEIQKLNNWANEIKILHDVYPEAKIFLAGSASLVIDKKQKESLAGRFFLTKITPLDFKEFLEFRQVSYDFNKLEIYKKDLEREIIQFIKTSGFPELINEDDDEFIREYFRQTIIDRVVFQDIPQVFDINEPQLLKEIFITMCSNPGQIIQYDSLGNDFKRDRRTIQNYLSFLENSYLLKMLFGYSTNLLTRYKKNKKAYPSYTCFTFSILGSEIFEKNLSGPVIENLVLNKLGTDFFFRTPQGKEVDFIYLKDGKRVPVEVKYREEISKKNIQPVIEFLNTNNSKEGIIITKNIEKNIKQGDAEIKFIPLLKFLLE